MKTKVSKLLLLAAIFALPLCVSAEEAKPSDFNDEQTVVVGEVDTTVYSVDIEWGDLSYDWKYDKGTNSFGFKSPLACQGILANANYGLGRLQEAVEEGYKVYDDNQCSTPHTGDFVEGNVYYAQNGIYSSIRVLDNSINGRIKAKVEFNPSSSYNWVIGKFYQNYTLAPVTEKIEYQIELTDGYLPVYQLEDTREMYGYLKLDVNNEYTGEKVVEQGSTIGTITLEISEDTN